MPSPSPPLTPAETKGGREIGTFPEWLKSDARSLLWGMGKLVILRTTLLEEQRSLQT